MTGSSKPWNDCAFVIREGDGTDRRVEAWREQCWSDRIAAIIAVTNDEHAIIETDTDSMTRGGTITTSARCAIVDALKEAGAKGGTLGAFTYTTVPAASVSKLVARLVSILNAPGVVERYGKRAVTWGGEPVSERGWA